MGTRVLHLTKKLLRAAATLVSAPLPGAAVIMAAVVPYLAASRTLTAASNTAADDGARRQVTAVEARRVAAKRNGDSQSLEDLLTPDFVNINRFGRLLDRRQTIALARSPRYSTRDTDVRVYGDGAVVTGRESDEGDPAGMVRFLRVWIRDGQRWLEFAEETTRITSETEAARLANGKLSTDTPPDRGADGLDANDLPQTTSGSSPPGEALRMAERAYRDAERIDDLSILDRYRAPEFRLVDRLGKLVQRPNSVRPIVNAVRDDQFGVRLHGDLGVVIGSVTRINAATAASDRYRYSSVWVQQRGWHVVAEQRTPIG